MTQKPKNLPAIILDMPNEEYHRGEWSRDFVSSTQLKNLLISPKAFDYLRRIGGVEISLEASMKGSVYHAILASIANTGCLDEFESEYFVFEPPINPTTGAAYGISSQKYQIAYQQALAEHPGMEATSQAEVDLANTMVEALLHHCGNTSESISQLLEWGTAEISHFVEYEGLGFKFRTDLKTSRKIVDWKTISSKDLHEETITSQINKMNYGFRRLSINFLIIWQQVNGPSFIGCSNRKNRLTMLLSYQQTHGRTANLTTNLRFTKEPRPSNLKTLLSNISSAVRADIIPAQKCSFSPT